MIESSTSASHNAFLSGMSNVNDSLWVSARALFSIIGKNDATAATFVGWVDIDGLIGEAALSAPHKGGGCFSFKEKA